MKKHKWIDISDVLHGPKTVHVLQEHQPGEPVKQWGVYTKDGNNVSLSSYCNIEITRAGVYQDKCPKKK